MRMLHKATHECSWMMNGRNRAVMTSLESAMGSGLFVQYPFAAGYRKEKESFNALAFMSDSCLISAERASLNACQGC